MNAIAPLSGSLGARPGGVATSPADEIDLERMLLKLEQDAINYKIALRVQEVGMPSQPLSKIDATDLALMIVSGSTMGRVYDALTAGGPAGPALPPAYRANA